MLDHVVVSSAMVSVYSATTGTITMRDSNLLVSGDNVIEGGGTWNIYSTALSTTPDNNESVFYDMSGTVNLYAGTTAIGLGSGCTPNIYVYPGVYFGTSSKGCTWMSSQ